MIHDQDVLAFSIAILGTLIVGCFTGLGDCTLLGYMKIYPPEILSGYASGTGFAGIFGTLYYLVFKNIHVSNDTNEANRYSVMMAFLVLMPISTIYLLTFNWVKNKRSKIGLIEGVDNETADSSKNKSLSCFQIKNTYQKVGSFMVNVMAVYF